MLQPYMPEVSRQIQEQLQVKKKKKIVKYLGTRPQAKGKIYREGVAWVELVTTSNLLALPHSHIKGKKISSEGYIIWSISLKYVRGRTLSKTMQLLYNIIFSGVYVFSTPDYSNL